MGKKKFTFAPQPEIEYFSITVDNKRFSEVLPYRGEYRKTIDHLRHLHGVIVRPVTPADLRRNRCKTVLYKRVLRVFDKAYQYELDQDQK